MFDILDEELYIYIKLDEEFLTQKLKKPRALVLFILSVLEN